MSDDDRRTGARFITELGVVLRPSKGGEPLDDRATAHDVSVKGFKLETQAQLAENMILSFTLELPMGANVTGKGRVVWNTRETFSTWAGVEIVSMSWSDKRRLSQLLNPGGADWERLSGLCIKLVMALVVIAAAHRIVLSAPLRALVGQLAPKILALMVMGWALLGMLKRGRR
jgi:hypothetical protein